MRGKLSRTFPFAIALICLASLLLAIGCGSSSARYRFVLAATGLSNNVDLQVDGKTVQSAVGYGQTATYHSSSSGSHKFEIFPAGTTSNPYASGTIKLSGDTTVIMQSTPQPNPSILLSPFSDENTAPTTGNVKIRIIDSSPSAGLVDVYVIPTGTTIGGLSPQISSMNFNNPQPGQYLTLPTPPSPGSYDVIVTQAGTQNILNGLTGTYSINALQIKTIVLLDASFGGGPFQQLVLNDLN